MIKLKHFKYHSKKKKDIKAWNDSGHFAYFKHSASKAENKNTSLQMLSTLNTT